MSAVKPNTPIYRDDDPLNLTFALLMTEAPSSRHPTLATGQQGLYDLSPSSTAYIFSSARYSAFFNDSTVFNTSDVDGNVVSLNGTSGSYIASSDYTIWDWGANPVSVSMRVRMNVANAATMFLSQQAGPSIWYGTSNLRVNANDSTGILALPWSFSADTWYDIVYTRTAANLHSLYINGVLLGSTTSSTAFTATTNVVRLGGFFVGGFQLAGRYSHFLMSNRAWTEDEVSELSRNPYWAFDPYILSP